MNNNLDHIALILDGNKRWAQKNNLSNIHGYTKGFENIINLVNYSLTIKLSNLTIFTLSTENFNRSSLKILYQIIYENFSKMFDEIVRRFYMKDWRMILLLCDYQIKYRYYTNAVESIKEKSLSGMNNKDFLNLFQRK